MILPLVSIGDPAIVTGGSALLFYGGIIAGIIASVLAWYINHRRSRLKGKPLES